MRSSLCLSTVSLLSLSSLLLLGCGKADRYQVESAVMGSIYQDRSFFDTLCGFALETSPGPRVEIVNVEGDALPWLGLVESKPVPGTATIRLVDAIKKGESTKQTCQASIAFQWKVVRKPVTDRRHKVGETSDDYVAEGFRKL
ncbi:MAG: hypothetical protein JW940_07365 [Polyangiaceae bacterium]|nr:hypothetical protein [Polyangiaceae bacterium]